MQEASWIYTTGPKNRYRFILGKKGRKMLAIIGANPSTASPEKPDRTVARMQKIAMNHGYDGWVLFNLWPERETHPDQLRRRMIKDIHHRNLEQLQRIFRQYPVTGIWAAWGNIIEKRSFLFQCLCDIGKMGPCRALPWFQLDTPTMKGHPRHPLYQSDRSSLIPFSIESYTVNYRR